MKKKTYMIQEALSVTFATQAQTRVSTPSQSRVSTSKDIRVFNIQMKVTTSASMTCTSNVTFASTFARAASFLPIQKVCFCCCNQFNSILVKAIDSSTSSIVHRQPGRCTVSDLEASRSSTVHSRRLKSR